MTKIAIVTGSNKGIGFAIVRGLSKVFDGHVYLTARNVSLGEKAISDLKSELPAAASEKIKLHQLDITDSKSVDTFKQYIQKQYGAVDVLVNNAGFAFKQADTAPFSEQAEVTNNINYFGTRRMCEAFFPLLRENSRVVNVTSMAGIITGRSSYGENVRAKLKSPTLTLEELDKLVTEFIQFVGSWNFI